MRPTKNIARIFALALLAWCSVDTHQTNARAAAADFRLTPWPRHATQPRFDLIDTAGRARTLADFRGKLLVVFFGFLNCPDFCPSELTKLSIAMKQLGPQADGVQVIFVTLDPARDDGNLDRYVTSFSPRFVGLTGTDDQINRAASSFNVNYARVAMGNDYTISHSTSVFVLDKVGRLRLIASTSATAADISHDLEALGRE